MQHEGHSVPVTALAFFREGITLAGEGNYIRVYTAGHQALKELRVFESQVVHGIIVDTSTFITLVWGGPLVRSLSLDLIEDGNLNISLGCVKNTGDWILDAAFASPTEDGVHRVALITAHNALLVTDVNTLSSPRENAEFTAFERLTPGSNCILYSAHVRWLSHSRCLIACGTAFGDIILSSVFLYLKIGKIYAQTETHYTFSAHEGSIFGVRISPLLALPERQNKSRFLASCSDDRNIKLWDITDAAIQSTTTLPQVERVTGFGTSGDDAVTAPPCLARLMGHISRIWHVGFGQGFGSVPGELISFGEDATVITWTAKPNANSSNPAYSLEKTSVAAVHSGKNIWSVANYEDEYLATGGADGAIAFHARMPDADKTMETSCSTPVHFNNNEKFRSYCFVDADVLVATTEQGQIVLMDISRPGQDPSVTMISASLPGLRGYSVVASLPGIAFVAGTDGHVFAYLHPSGTFAKVLDINEKVASILTSQSYSSVLAVLVTSVGASTAELLIMNYNRNTAEIQVTEAVKLVLPHSFIVTGFAIPMHRSAKLAVLGSRNSLIAWYGPLKGAEFDPVPPSRVLEHVHGEEAVTALYWETRDCQPDHQSGWLYSTGRDGTFAVHHTRLSDRGVELSLVHQLHLPFGPNIEGINAFGGRMQVWGFKSKYFVAYDVSLQREVMTVECGGAHRHWAFQPNDNEGTFVWTKASKLYRKTQSKPLCELINPGGHGREIKSVSISSCTSETQITATGAEDTNIKLFKCNKGNFKLLQTLRKHNTGIQCLKWSKDGRHLFSSGGFEEFFVWRVTPAIPHIDVGVLCESTHPRSGTSDLRILGFEVAEEVANVKAARFTISMVYSDSTVRLWCYANGIWDLLASADYLTSCLTDIVGVGNNACAFLTAATDGHIARWHLDPPARSLRWTDRHKVHQNAIHVMTICTLADGSILAITGGDDNAIGFTRLTNDHQATTTTLLVTRAHAAAVTGIALVPVDEATYWLASGGIDQRVKLWQIEVDPAQPGVDGIAVKRLQDVYTAVADVSSLDLYTLEDGETGVLVCGVGMDMWRLPTRSQTRM